VTKLTKPVRRKAEREFGRSLIVTLYPNGLVGIRELRRRREHMLPLSRIYRIAVEATVEADRKAKQERKAQIRKDAGLPPLRRLVSRGLLRP
jgi:hypothetical protein